MSKFARMLAACGLAASLHAAVKPPALLSDHMVLQQGVPVCIWGAADAGESVRVEFQGQTVTGKAAESRKWSVWLKPLSAAGPLEMTVNGTVIKDVLVGEVWLGSGQSNMEFALNQAVNHEEEIAHADDPLIHAFLVKRIVADQPADDVAGAWQVCTPQNAGRFSAVEYFFGRALHNHLHVPMGLIQSYWGGTPAQSWTSTPMLQSDAALKFVADEWDRVLAGYPAVKARVPVTGFTIAAADGKFVPAEGKIDGATIVVSSPEVASPVAVRYAWADDPVCNLINQAGLPAGPFRSDEPHYAQ